MDKKIEWHPALEQEMKELSGKIQGKIEVGRNGREATREVVGERIAREIPDFIPKKGELSISVLPEYADAVSPELRLEVEKIVDDYWHDGNILKAVNAAAGKGAAVLDLFHDTLTGKMHDALKTEGLL